MPFINYFDNPFPMYTKADEVIKAQLDKNGPALFLDDTKGAFLAFCVIDQNLEPLEDETLKAEDMHPERVPAKFAIAMGSPDFSWFTLRNCIVFILRLPEIPPADEPGIIEKYAVAAQDFISIVEADFSISLSVSVSALFRAFGQCLDMVRDALIRVDYICYIEQRSSVVDPLYYQDMQRLLARQHPEYRLPNYERPALAAVLSQNYLHAELVINKFLVAHLCDPLEIFPTINSAILNLCRTAMALSCRSPLDFSVYFSNSRTLARRMRLCRSISEMKQLIHLYFIHIREFAERNKSFISSSEKMNRIIAFIDANFKDPSFNAGMISSQFDVTPAYLSRLFKEQMGINFLSYVQTLRIEAAKDLLCNSEMTIDKIATEVGYYSSQNLLRLFKKYEGISPTEYRTMRHAMAIESTADE